MYDIYMCVSIYMDVCIYVCVYVLPTNHPQLYIYVTYKQPFGYFVMNRYHYYPIKPLSHFCQSYYMYRQPYIHKDAPIYYKQICNYLTNLSHTHTDKKRTTSLNKNCIQHFLLALVGVMVLRWLAMYCAVLSGYTYTHIHTYTHTHTHTQTHTHTHARTSDSADAMDAVRQL